MVFNNSPLKLYMMEAPTRMCGQHIDFRYVCNAAHTDNFSQWRRCELIYNQSMVQ